MINVRIRNSILTSLTISVLLVFVNIAELHAQAMWNAEDIANQSARTVNLTISGGKSAGTIPVSFVKELLEIKMKIQSAAGIQSELWIQAGSTPNAWASPSGNRYVIAFNLPMLVAFENDKDALAAVMGHEIAHLVRQHVPARQTNDSTVAVFGAFFRGLFEGVIQNRYQISGVGSSIADIGVVMAKTAFDRDQEREADKFGLEWMNEAGYDAQGALRLWKKMGDIAPNIEFSFLSTHPSSNERFENIKRQIASLPAQRNVVSSKSPSYQISSDVSGAKAPNVATSAEPMQHDAKTRDNQQDTVKNGYCVQVAVLNDPQLVNWMREQIAATGIKVYIEAVPMAKGNVTRVRAGPFASRGDADKARDKLKGMGFNGNVIPL